ncbi:unnamed protein product [Gadus morhua 'NCC']
MSTDTFSSSYRQGKQQDVRARASARAEKPKVKAEGTCIYCGEAGHSKTPQWHARRAECPAYGKTCWKGSRQNHLDKFYPVHSDRPPPRSIYDNLASRVAVPALIATPQLPGLASGQVRPVTESGPTPPPALPPAGSPWRRMQPTSIVPVVPAQGVPRTPRQPLWPLWPLSHAARRVAGVRLALVHQEGRCACLA